MTVFHVVPLLAQSLSQGFAPDCGTQATRVAAAADPVVVARDADVSDGAGRALGSVVDASGSDDPATDPSFGDLDEEKVGDLMPPQGGVFAPRHQIDVVVDHHRHAEAHLEVVCHRKVVPPGHARRCDCPTCGVFHRTGEAHANAADLGDGSAGLGEQSLESIDHPVEVSPRSQCH